MKNKCFFSFLLAVVIILSVSFCGFLAPAASAEAAAVEIQTDTAAVLTEEGADVDLQLELIFSQLDKLEQKDSSNTWYYSVTDLDRDGSLEFVAASLHPQDRSTNLRVWEVSEDRTALTECGLEKDPEESFPDIMTDNADTYHDPQTDTWYYMVYDNVVISDTEVYTFKTAVSMKDGMIDYDAYAIEHSVLKNAYRDVTHLDTNGIAISAEQYNAAGANAFAAAERSNTNFDWFTLENAGSLSRLADSYSVFAGVKEPTEVFPVPQPAALVHPEATATPMPTTMPTPVPSAQPIWLMITKNPTNENRKEGDTALFVACANAYESLSWTFVSPNGGEYSPQNFISGSRASVSGEYSTTIAVTGVEKWMNGWGAYCTFYYQGQTARTSTAYIYVKDADKKPVPPTPTPQQGGVEYGTVTGYSFSSVTISITGKRGVVVPFSLCDISGEIYEGATAAVSFTGKSATDGTVTYVHIDGRQPTPQPTYGSMSGRAYQETERLLTVFLQNGNSVALPTGNYDGYTCNIYGGTVSDIGFTGGGASCIVYYINTPTVENIYELDVFIEPKPEPEPEPAPAPEPEPAPAPEPEPAPAPEPEPAPAPEPEPAPAPEPEPAPAPEPEPAPAPEPEPAPAPEPEPEPEPVDVMIPDEEAEG